MLLERQELKWNSVPKKQASAEHLVAENLESEQVAEWYCFESEFVTSLQLPQH